MVEVVRMFLILVWGIRLCLLGLLPLFSREQLTRDKDHPRNAVNTKHQLPSRRTYLSQSSLFSHPSSQKTLKTYHFPFPKAQSHLIHASSPNLTIQISPILPLLHLNKKSKRNLNTFASRSPIIEIQIG